jgi:hypothetical protein
MPIDWKGISEKVVVAVIAAAILGALALLWNLGSGGGLVRALGGLTADDLAAKILVATDGQKSRGTGDRDREQPCPEKSTLIGGACNCDTANINRSYIKDPNTWYCTCSAPTPTNSLQIAYAICLKH